MLSPGSTNCSHSLPSWARSSCGTALTGFVLIAAAFSLAACSESAALHRHVIPAARAKTSQATPLHTYVSIGPNCAALKDIRTDIAAVRPLPIYVEANGQLQPNANCVTRVSAPISGKVSSISANVGELIKPGQTVATITSPEIGALVTDLFKTETDISSELSKDLLEIDFDRKKAESEVALSQKQLDRAKLLQEEKITAVAAVEALQTAVDQHKLTIAALDEKRLRTQRVADDRKAMHRLALHQKLLLLGMPEQTIAAIMNSHSLVCTIPIHSSQGGFVLERNINIGELVDPSKTLFIVDDMDNLWLVADIFEQDIKYVKKGDPVDFTIDSFPNELFKGKLDFVAGTICPETRTLSVRAVIANHKLRLKPQMFARMKILVGTEHCLTVPKTAVQDCGSHKIIYVKASNGRFEERQVQTGHESDQYVEITNGLSAGDAIVVSGSFSLHSQALKQSR